MGCKGIVINYEKNNSYSFFMYQMPKKKTVLNNKGFLILDKNNYCHPHHKLASIATWFEKPIRVTLTILQSK